MTRFIYFDEVKPNPNSFPDYLIAGFSVSADQLPVLAEQFRQVTSASFEKMSIPPGTEVHAQFVYHGKGAFKGKPIDERIELLANLLSLLEPDELRLVFSRIRVNKLYSESKALEFAFMHFCERAHGTLSGSEVGMMIGDLDRATRNELWAQFSHYRQNGTSWAYGQDLPKFIDTVHFVDSRVCELVQLADVYAFQTSNDGQRTGYANDLMLEKTKELNLFPTRYKDWPGAWS